MPGRQAMLSTGISDFSKVGSEWSTTCHHKGGAQRAPGLGDLGHIFSSPLLGSISFSFMKRGWCSARIFNLFSATDGSQYMKTTEVVIHPILLVLALNCPGSGGGVGWGGVGCGEY